MSIFCSNLIICLLEMITRTKKNTSPRTGRKILKITVFYGNSEGKIGFKICLKVFKILMTAAF